MLVINADIVSIDFTILRGNPKHETRFWNGIWKWLKNFLSDAVGNATLFVLRHGRIPDWVLALLTSELKESAKIYGIELVAVNIKNTKEVQKMLNISVSIENIDAKKIVAHVLQGQPAASETKIDTAALLYALEPYADNILNALLPAVPGVMSALEEYIKKEAAKAGITLLGLKVSV
jgi:hypothetical protein